MHLWFTYYLWHIYMFEMFNNITTFFNFFISFSKLVIQSFMADALAFFESGSYDQLLMITISEFELNNLWVVQVKMSFFICVICDFLLFGFKLADIDSCRANVVVDVLGKSTKIVKRVLGGFKLVPETLILILFVLLLFLPLCLL